MINNIREDLLKNYKVTVKDFVEGEFYALIKFKGYFFYEPRDIITVLDCLLNKYNFDVISFDIYNLKALLKRK